MTSEKKIKFVQELAKKAQSYPVIAVVDMQSLPARQLQNMRAQLYKRGIELIMARKRLLELSLKNSQKENITALIEKMRGMPALILSKENPFLLYSTLQKSKSQAPAKANQIAPKDIVVKAGGTNFAPGPIISELASVGIKTKVEGGKLAIVNDATVAKEGAIITAKLAEVLKRLNIQPMEIGLNVVAAWDNAIIFSAKQLHVDEEEYYNNIVTAFQEALNLAMEVAYPTTETVELLLQKAFRDSKAVALEQEIFTDATTEEILAKSERQALSLKEAASLEIPEKKEQPKAEVKQETPKEEKQPEVKEEVKVKESVKEIKKEEKPVEEKAEEKKEIKKEKPAEKPIEPKQEEKKPAEEPKQENLKPAAEPSEADKEDLPSAEEMIKATQEKFAPKKIEPKVEDKPSAESLVDEELKKADAEKPPKEVQEVEALYEKLKKQGSLK
ncbi:MAG: 50S ribosomal protein L10 [Candidatus Woesearchaeota archaeon]